MLASFTRVIAFAVFGWFSLDLLLRAFLGHEIKWMHATKSPLNAESFISLVFLLGILSRGTWERTPASSTKPESRSLPRIALFLLVALCLASFAWSLSTPFVFDDYGHVAFASTASLRTIGNMFFHPHSDIFFRPVGFFSYLVNFQWAHWEPFRWHCWNLVLHILNCLLVYVLSRVLGFNTFTSGFAGAVFAVHGSRAEPVCWTDAQFDLLVTLFVLSSLICFGRYLKTPRWQWLTAGMTCTALAFGAKETGFCLPLCLAALLFFYGREKRRKILKLTMLVSALAVLAFLYRWHMLGGIGGYATGGHPNALNVQPMLVAKALGWRIWSLAFFPINWADHIAWWLAGGVSVFLIVLILVAVKTRVPLCHALGGIALLIAASLPALSVLLIGSDLAGARVLYLPVFGLALFWASVLEGTAGQKTLAYVLVVGVLGFNILALQHNIRIWRQVAQKAQTTCASFGRQLSSIKGRVEVYGVPEKYRGVYFLRNAFPECVEHNSGFPASRLSVIDSPSPAAGETVKAHTFTWDPGTMEFRPFPFSRRVN